MFFFRYTDQVIKKRVHRMGDVRKNGYPQIQIELLSR